MSREPEQKKKKKKRKLKTTETISLLYNSYELTNLPLLVNLMEKLQLLRLYPFPQVDLPAPETDATSVLAAELELLLEYQLEELLGTLGQYPQCFETQHLMAEPLDPAELKGVRHAAPQEEHPEKQDQ